MYSRKPNYRQISLRPRRSSNAQLYMFLFFGFVIIFCIHIFGSTHGNQETLIVSSSSEEIEPDTAQNSPVVFPRPTFKSPDIADENKLPYQHAVLLMPDLIKHLRWSVGENVLDYGCNDGNTGYYAILPHVEKWKGHLYGIDVAQASIDKAKAKFPHPLVTYGRGSLTNGNSAFEDFPWPELRFHKIFAIYVLHFVYDMHAALQRFNEALLPDGQFAFITLTAQSWAFQVSLELSRMDEWKEYMQNFETTNYPAWSKFDSNQEGELIMKDYLEMAGFDVAFLKIGDWLVYSGDAEFYINSFNYLSPSLQDVPQEKLSSLRDQIAKLFTKYTGYSRLDKNVTVTYQYVMGVGRKK